MITYTRNADNTFTKAGSFAAAPAEVMIQIDGGKPFAQRYNLQQATQLIEDAISKGQVKKDKYSILPIPEVVAKAPRAPRVPKELKVKEPKGPRVVKYSKDDMLRVYAETKSLDEVVKQVGASRIWAQRVLVNAGVFEKPVREAKPEVTFTPEQEARITVIIEQLATQTEIPATRQSAVKQLKKEERAANRPAKAPKAPRVLKYSKEDFVKIYTEQGHSLDAVVAQTGASRVWAQRVLVAQGVWVKPVKVAAVVPAPVAEPQPEEPKAAKAPKAVKEPKAPKAPKTPAAPKPAAKKKSAPNQEVPPVETKSAA